MTFDVHTAEGTTLLEDESAKPVCVVPARGVLAIFPESCPPAKGNIPRGWKQFLRHALYL
jgi:hypothetical protein